MGMPARMVHLFYNFNLIGGAGAFLLVPEITSFHSNPSLEFLLT